MTIPNLLLGLIIALLIANIYHFIRGGNGWRLLLSMGVSIAGFFVSHWLSRIIGWGLYQIGGLEAGLGAIGSVLFLIMSGWLVSGEADKKSKV